MSSKSKPNIVHCIKDVSTGIQILKFPTTYQTNYRVDGVDIEVSHSKKEFVTATVPEKVEVVVKRNQLSHWVHRNQLSSEGNQTEQLILTIEEYTVAQTGYTCKGYFDDDIESMVFDNIEDEVAFRHFKRDWIAEYKPVEEVTDCEIVYLERPISEYDCIVPAASLDDIKTIEDGLCYYTPPLVQWFREICAEYGIVPYESRDRTDPTQLYYKGDKNLLEYVQINNDYVWLGDPKPFNRSNTRWPKPYKELVEQIAKDKATIRKAVVAMVIKFRPVEIDAVLLSDVVEFIKSIKRDSRKIESKVKTERERSNLIKRIDEFESKVTSHLVKITPTNSQ